MCGKYVAPVGTPAAAAAHTPRMAARPAGTRAAKDPEPSVLPAELAFVVCFGAGSRDAGRVEHVVSGRGARFGNREQLLAFINETLARIDGDDA